MWFALKLFFNITCVLSTWMLYAFELWSCWAARLSGHPPDRDRDHFCVELGRGNERPLVLAAELAVVCGCTSVTALLPELLLSPPMAVPQWCRNALRPVPNLILGCLVG